MHMNTPENENKKLGFVKIYRSILHNGWLKNHKLTIGWLYCLLKASHREREVLIGNRKVLLKPGQFIFGREKAVSETGLSPRSLRTVFKRLSLMQNLTIQTTNKYSLITVVNWEFYQTKEAEVTSKTTSKRPANDQQVTSKRPASDHIQEVKNGKNGQEVKNGEKKILLYAEIVEDFNKITESNYKTDPVTKDIASLIDARIDDGFTIEDFKKVHKNKLASWGNDPKMKKFLRPHTLYTAKFQAYLNERVSLSDQGRISPTLEKSKGAFERFLAKEGTDFQLQKCVYDNNKACYMDCKGCDHVKKTINNGG